MLVRPYVCTDDFLTNAHTHMHKSMTIFFTPGAHIHISMSSHDRTDDNGCPLAKSLRSSSWNLNYQGADVTSNRNTFISSVKYVCPI